MAARECRAQVQPERQPVAHPSGWVKSNHLHTGVRTCRSGGGNCSLGIGGSEHGLGGSGYRKASRLLGTKGEGIDRPAQARPKLLQNRSCSAATTGSVLLPFGPEDSHFFPLSDGDKPKTRYGHGRTARTRVSATTREAPEERKFGGAREAVGLAPALRQGN